MFVVSVSLPQIISFNSIKSSAVFIHTCPNISIISFLALELQIISFNFIKSSAVFIHTCPNISIISFLALELQIISFNFIKSSAVSIHDCPKVCILSIVESRPASQIIFSSFKKSSVDLIHKFENTSIYFFSQLATIFNSLGESFLLLQIALLRAKIFHLRNSLASFISSSEVFIHLTFSTLPFSLIISLTSQFINGSASSGNIPISFV
nr:hypothetical protein [bacterium]